MVCRTHTSRIRIIEVYAHTDLSNKNAFCYIAAFPLSVLWYRLKQDYEQRNIELNHEKLLFKWLVFLLYLHQRRRLKEKSKHQQHITEILLLHMCEYFVLCVFAKDLNGPRGRRKGHQRNLVNVLSLTFIFPLYVS